MSRDVRLQAEVRAAPAPSHPGEASLSSLTVTTLEALLELSRRTQRFVAGMTAWPRT